MSASTPGGPGAPAAAAPDPSMEDILASIRRILSEDEAAATPPAPDPEVAAPADHPADDDDVLALDTSMLVEEAPAAAPPVVAPPVVAPPVVAPRFAPTAVEVPPPAPVSAPPASAPPAAASQALLDPAAAAAAASSVGELVRTLAGRQTPAVYRGGPTLEDLVRDEMRPLLKAWLDENLPPLVERLVRAEIERVVARAVS